MKIVRIIALCVGALLVTAMSCNGGGGIQADLTVGGIGLPAVECPTGAGSCVTTVDVTVENIGAGFAGVFNVRVTFDPAQSVVVNRAVPGLAAGASTTFTVASPPGGNCFDPDCTVSVLVDDANEVPESNETNNEDSQTRIG